MTVYVQTSVISLFSLRFFTKLLNFHAGFVTIKCKFSTRSTSDIAAISTKMSAYSKGPFKTSGYENHWLQRYSYNSTALATKVLQNIL